MHHRNIENSKMLNQAYLVCRCYKLSPKTGLPVHPTLSNGTQQSKAEMLQQVSGLRNGTVHVQRGAASFPVPGLPQWSYKKPRVPLNACAGERADF